MIKYFNNKNIISGAIIYGIGDSIGSLILNEFSWIRLIGLAFIGGTVYAIEIPAFFDWLESYSKKFSLKKSQAIKTILTTLFFNPIWIARHFIFIFLFSGNFASINLNLLHIAWLAYITPLPITLFANYLIQNKVNLTWRFPVSAIFSALMVIYFALSKVIFN